MKKTLQFGLLVLTLACIIAFQACAGEKTAPITETPKDTVAPEPVILKYATFAPPTMFIVMGDNWWLEQVTERTNGAVQFETFYGGSLLKGADVLSGVKDGIADIGFMAAGYTPALLPLSTVLELPYTCTSPTITTAAIKELANTFKPLQDEWAKQNLKFLHTTPPSPSVIETSEKMVKTLEDLKGLQIRAFGYTGNTINMLGGVAVAVPAAEILISLERGLVEGITGEGFSFAVARGQHKLAPYFLDPGFGVYALAMTAINLNTWNSLPTNVQQIMEEVSNEMAQKYAEILLSEEQKALETAQQDGCQFYILPPEEKARWTSIVLPKLWDDAIADKEEQGLPARELLDAYLKLVEKFKPGDKYVHPFTLVQ